MEKAAYSVCIRLDTEQPGIQSTDAERLSLTGVVLAQDTQGIHLVPGPTGKVQVENKAFPIPHSHPCSLEKGLS